EAIFRGACPIVASYGRHDPMPGNKHAAERLGSTLDALQVTNNVSEHPDAGHSFMDDYGRVNRHAPGGWLARRIGLGYNEDAAEDAWARIIAFFRRYLDSDPESTRSGRGGPSAFANN